MKETTVGNTPAIRNPDGKRPLSRFHEETAGKRCYLLMGDWLGFATGGVFGFGGEKGCGFVGLGGVYGCGLSGIRESFLPR
jgi:hypothetical protein